MQQGLGGQQRGVAVGDDHGAVQVGWQLLQRALGGAAGALDLVLVGDDRVGPGLLHHRDDAVALGAHGDRDVLGPGVRGGEQRVADEGAATDGVLRSDFMRVLSPAASAITATGTAVTRQLLGFGEPARGQASERRCYGVTACALFLPEADGDPAQPPPPPSDPTARATTSRLVNNAADACRPIRHFARADNGIVSVGLNALELVRDM